MTKNSAIFFEWYDHRDLKMKNPRLPFWTGRVFKINGFSEAKTLRSEVKKVINQINERYEANKTKPDETGEADEAEKERKADIDNFDYNTKRPGVYILIGEENGEKLAYIGKAEDDIGNRLPQSLKESKKYCWCKDIVLVVETGGNLDLTYVKYLESRLVKIAKDLGNIPLTQSDPKLPQLLSTRAEMMENNFLRNLLLIMDVLEVNIFTGWQKHISKQYGEDKRMPVDKKTISHVSPPIFRLVSKQGDIYDASLRYEVKGKNEKFVVLKGSYARGKWTGKNDYGKDEETINELKHNKILTQTPDRRWQFNEDYSFDYISAAAKVIVGRNANGYVEWKVNAEGREKTFREWKAGN